MTTEKPIPSVSAVTRDLPEAQETAVQKAAATLLTLLEDKDVQFAMNLENFLYAEPWDEQPPVSYIVGAEKQELEDIRAGKDIGHSIILEKQLSDISNVLGECWAEFHKLDKEDIGPGEHQWSEAGQVSDIDGLPTTPVYIKNSEAESPICDLSNFDRVYGVRPKAETVLEEKHKQFDAALQVLKRDGVQKRYKFSLSEGEDKGVGSPF